MNPDEHTINEHTLAVGGGHKLYIQDWGNKSAKTPILFLHGGPGGGVNDGHKQRFDPSKQRVIFFDQRGSGRSIPTGSLKNNNTDELVEDIEKIANYLKIKEFIITGGSWGSCLALCYALKYPKRVKSMVLSGIFTARKEEIDYLNGGFKDFFPDVWQEFLSRTPAEFQNDPMSYHLEKAFAKNQSQAKKSIYAVAELESSILKLDDRHTPMNYADFDPNWMKIEMYYIKNNCFLPENYILDFANKLKMPIWLVQGRYDAICPPKTAYSLHQKLPNSQLIWTVAGHGNDRGNYDVMRSLLLSLA